MGFNVRLIVPTQNEGALGPVVGKIVGRWGGVTVSKADGWWRATNADDVPVQDKVSVLECSIECWRSADREWWCDLAGVVRVSFDQESVFLSVHEETAAFVEYDGVDAIGPCSRPTDIQL